MKYEKMSELLKKQRQEVDKTIYVLADQVGITPSYLSQVENGNKLPSKQVFFKLLVFLKNSALDYSVFFHPILKLYAEYKNLDFDTLEKEFYEFLNEHTQKIMSNMSEHINAISKNKLRVSKFNYNEQGEVLEYPYFDLKWLLEQRDFEVFYGRQYDIQNAVTNDDSHPRDRVLYSRLNDIDLKVISSIIEAYISNVYPYVYQEDIKEDTLRMLEEFKEDSND